jgi:membrane-associated phospholipid phosphatase
MATRSPGERRIQEMEMPDLPARCVRLGLRLVAAVIALSTTLVLVSPTASADEPARVRDDPQRVYDLDPMIDLPLLGLGLAATSAAFLEVPPPACIASGVCTPPDDMPGYDSAILGRYSPSAHSAANVIVMTLVLGPPLWSALDSRDASAWFADSVVHGESLLLTQGLTQIVKFAVRRPAPLVYDESVPIADRESRDGARSFWSGHTATAFSAATTHAVTYWLRHPRDPWRFTVLAADLTAAAAVGLLKMEAGYHYPSDVAAGALVGTSIGVLVPMLHRRF